MRAARSHEKRAEMCRRLRWLIENCLGWTWQQAARELHYKTTGTLYQVRAGKQVPDIERLAVLAQKISPDGRSPNVDWIVTGRGAPLINVNKDDAGSELANEIAALPTSKQKTLRTLVKQLS